MTLCSLFLHLDYGLSLSMPLHSCWANEMLDYRCNLLYWNFHQVIRFGTVKPLFALHTLTHISHYEYNSICWRRLFNQIFAGSMGNIWGFFLLSNPDIFNLEFFCVMLYAFVWMLLVHHTDCTDWIDFSRRSDAFNSKTFFAHRFPVQNSVAKDLLFLHKHPVTGAILKWPCNRWKFERFRWILKMPHHIRYDENACQQWLGF